MIVEGTAGNTGIGLSLVGNALGYKTTIVIPDTQSQEKKDAIIFSGAKLIQVPAVPYKDRNNYIKYSGNLAEDLNKELMLLVEKRIKLTRQKLNLKNINQ